MRAILGVRSLEKVTEFGACENADQRYLCGGFLVHLSMSYEDATFASFFSSNSNERHNNCDKEWRGGT